MPQFTLYGNRGSIPTDRVRLLLAIINFTDYEFVQLDFARGDLKVLIISIRTTGADSTNVPITLPVACQLNASNTYKYMYPPPQSQSLQQRPSLHLHILAHLFLSFSFPEALVCVRISSTFKTITSLSLEHTSETAIHSHISLPR